MAVGPAPERRAIPGGRLWHPAPAAAALLILVNDFCLRPQWPYSFITGKLSDVGINFLLPVVLVAGCEMLAWIFARSRFQPLGTRAILACALLSSGYFGLLKAVPAFTAVHTALLGFVARSFVDHFHATNTADPTDLATLLMTPLAVWYLIRNRPAASRTEERHVPTILEL